MRSNGWSAGFALALGLTAGLFAGCGSGSPVEAELAAIFFETTSAPGGGAGQFYNVVIRFGTEGSATLPDRFSLVEGTLPTGVRLVRDLEDNDFDGLPDEDGAPTGHARLLRVPREGGRSSFTLKAIATRGSLTPAGSSSA